MFLLPPVPGVPVYLSLGIVLPAQGHELMGWTGSIFYSVAIGLMLKLGASAMQQKLVGERLSHIVKVRQFVGINSRFIKAMRLVLEKDGLDLAKVCILIGGPDWPTSVLCGILRLPLLQIMLGTAPIVFLIMPTCMSGAFLYMAFLETDGNPDFPWSATVSTITLTLTAIVQFGSMIVAAYYVERASANSDDIAAIPDDLEVKEVDDEEEHLRRCYQTATQWEAMPWLPKISLGASLVFIVTSSYMVQLFSSYCFTPHTLTDSIAENLDGKVSNLFLPLGWVSVALFGVSCTLLFLFMTWGEKKALQLVNESRGSSRVAPDDIQVSAEGTEVRLHSYGLSSLSFDAFHNVDS
ncbi:hypothetical protein THAOC_27558 [Thalassiosira oceanica]|uniref:Uncharacterized protein n=1 Tax=Thalassiosira oceanica TaxID=159749 RepID=K0RLB6_THAOC|nr:hypothetical protein THAOC_27558 [Thalassiosira oceanica]|eukprot:EJK53074.1 hypothetical protein THAOC_27558 [Thalassiosira oceanica]